ncbi:MAG: hypothetical protein LBI48_06495 [Burkholderiaceae bacterium]|jgi:hypothetical protein|nr:hypothetical protein [Burkholderiaceae bacterium]
MKKSILALGAAAVVGGLGFAGSAQALGYIGPGTVFDHTPAGMLAATDLAPAIGGMGHFLFVPYFSSQGNNATLLNITNTDMHNGKAVKVRFRGASNSDDVLDFTLFMSPGDMWSGNVSRDPNTGLSRLSSNDRSCSIPAFQGTGGENPLFKTERLPGYLSGDAQAKETREGYIEILNMADIWPDPATNSLFTNIKHVNGVAPCDYNAPVFQNMLDGTWWSTTTAITALQASPNDLRAPTGQLMASWAIVNNDTFATFSGSASAVRAVDASGATGYGSIMFTPQIEDPLPGGTADADLYTADPLLRAGAVLPLWFDLPDMSTPVRGDMLGSPISQASVLSNTLTHASIVNEYTLTDGDVPMYTDWVISQPTRRYFAAVRYGATAGTSAILWNPDIDSSQAGAAPVTTPPSSDDNRYSLLSLTNGVACMPVGFSSASREEQFSASVGAWSPGTSKAVCGEVFTFTFTQPNAVSSLNASLTNTATSALNGVAGWAQLTLGGNNRIPLPVVGYAGILTMNNVTRGNLGATLPYRWQE